MRFLLVLAAALVLAPAALADVPAGFVSHPELAQRVQFVAGKPISVYCATTDAAWSQASSAHGLSDGSGFATVGSNEIYLVASSCSELLLKVTGRPFGWYEFSYDLLTLAHEAEHLAGHHDEHETDCAALASVRQLALNFGVRKLRNLARVMGYATQAHAEKPPRYSAPC